MNNFTDCVHVVLQLEHSLHLALMLTSLPVFEMTFTYSHRFPLRYCYHMTSDYEISQRIYQMYFNGLSCMYASTALAYKSV